MHGLVTIDVEPDNVWGNTQSRSFENLKWLSRFHEVCVSYAIRPTYLITYSVASDREACGVMEALLATGGCEIGAHPHFWEIPPRLEQDHGKIAWTGCQYDADVLIEKLTHFHRLLSSRFGNVTSYRSGRYGINGAQIRFLEEHGYAADSSVVPGFDWTGTGAPDFSDAPMAPYHPSPDEICKPGTSKIWEVPCTVKPGLSLQGMERAWLARRMFPKIGLSPRWLRSRPRGTIKELTGICRWVSGRSPCLNLMTHSAELCPGTSPQWATTADIEDHYKLMEGVFRWWREHDVVPHTLGEFCGWLNLQQDFCQ